jgi:hypothetical protein
MAAELATASMTLRELDEHPVTGCLDDATTMFGDFRVDKPPWARLQLNQRSLFVGPIRRLQPAMSAARMAVRLRSTRSLAKTAPFELISCRRFFRS